MSMPFVYLWDAARHGTPKTFEKALDLLNELTGKVEPSVSQSLVAFGEEFGRFIDGSGEESWLNVLAGTGAYAKGCKTAVLRLVLPDTDWQPVLVVMVELANKYGLVALYEDGVTLFLPDGKVLPAGRAKAWNGLRAALKDEGAFPQTLGKFKTWLYGQLELMLARHGKYEKGKSPWASDEQVYIGESENGACIYIGTHCSNDYNGFVFDLEFTLTHPKVAAVAHSFRFFMPEIVFRGCVKDLLGGGDWFELSVKNFRDAFKHLEVFEQVLFPVLHGFSSVKELNLILNGGVDIRYRNFFHNYVFRPQCLIVARLADNLRFEELTTELTAGACWGANEDVWKDEWPKLVKYLREEVMPVV